MRDVKVGGGSYDYPSAENDGDDLLSADNRGDG